MCSFKGKYLETSIWSFFRYSLTITGIKETSFQDYLVLLMRMVQNYKVMFPRYSMHGDDYRSFKSSTIHWCVIRRDRVVTERAVCTNHGPRHFLRHIDKYIGMNRVLASSRRETTHYCVTVQTVNPL